MSKKNLTIFLFFLIVLSGCSKSDDPATEQERGATSTSESETSEVQTEQEVLTETITFSETTSTTGSAVIEGNTVTISGGGDYTITGTSNDGQLIINAPNEDVNITLDNLTLTSSNTSAITVIDADSLTITLVGETTLSDTANNTDAYQAPLFIDEVETHILGDGILNLNGNYQEGLESNNDLYIDGGTINVTAVDDGINTGDLLSINAGTIYIDSNGDGLDSNGDLEITGGTTYVSGGNNGNGPIDYGDGYTFTLTGGTILAVGGNMGVTPTSNTQEFLTTTSSGTEISSGEYTYTAPKSFSYAFISYAGLTESSEVLIDGQSVTTSNTSTSQQFGSPSQGGAPF